MKRYAFLSRRGGNCRLVGFENGRPVGSPSALSGVMISRLDLDVRLLELPAMPEKEVEGFLGYRIRGLYPGHPEETAFDYRLLDRDGKRCAVLFMTRREILEECRSAAAGRPLFPSLSLLLPLASLHRAGRNRIGLFWHDGWLEALVLSKGEPPRTLVHKLGADPAADLAQVLGLAADDLTDTDCLLICPAQEQAELRKLLAGRLTESATLTTMSTIDALGRLARGPEPLFAPPKARFPVPRSLRLELASALVLLLLFLAFKRGADQDAARLASLRQSLQAAQGRSTQALALEAEIEALKARSAAMQGRRPADPYRVLAELASVLGAGTRINSFVLQRGTFQLEAVGADPLRLMEVFKGRGEVFRDVKLIQIVPLQNADRELFRITGYANAP